LWGNQKQAKTRLLYWDLISASLRRVLGILFAIEEH
jgi:hypothetical protein